MDRDKIIIGAILALGVIGLATRLVMLVQDEKIACSQCQKTKHWSNMLVVHITTNDGRKLSFPYCPKCCVEFLSTPAVTWVGTPKEQTDKK